MKKRKAEKKRKPVKDCMGAASGHRAIATPMQLGKQRLKGLLRSCLRRIARQPLSKIGRRGGPACYGNIAPPPGPATRPLTQPVTRNDVPVCTTVYCLSARGDGPLSTVPPVSNTAL